MLGVGGWGLTPHAHKPVPAQLGAELDRLYNGFNSPNSLVDPIELVRPYARREDREVAGFIASALAFGNVTAVMASGPSR